MSLVFQHIITHFQETLPNELPGTIAHSKMAPYAGRLVNFPGKEKARESGVLILLYPEGNQVKLVLILRPLYDGVHSGQVAFPGGRKEVEDRDITATALREAEEEVGIDRNEVQLLGKLTELYIPPSNSLVTPSIGYAVKKPVFVPDQREVAEIIEADVFHFTNEAVRSEMDVKVPNGLLKNVPYFSLNEHRIWGATAMMLSEFSEVLKKAGQ